MGGLFLAAARTTGKIKRKRVNEKEEPLLFQLVDLSSCQIRLREDGVSVSFASLSGEGPRSRRTPFPFVEFAEFTGRLAIEETPSSLSSFPTFQTTSYIRGGGGVVISFRDYPRG